MSISDKKQEIIDYYHCYVCHRECFEDCDNCRKILSDDLEEYANLIIQEFQDKVVEELEKKKHNALEVEQSIGDYQLWCKAIEIVKAGVSNE